MAPQIDSEGYTFDSPQGVKIRLSYWKDDDDRWELLHDITGLFMQGVKQALGSSSPIVHAFDDNKKTLKALFDESYASQVTGTNYTVQYWTIREKIRKSIADNVVVADVSGVWDYSLTLPSEGEYWAQLATRTSDSRCTAGDYRLDPNHGGVLRFKYIVRSIDVRFTVGLTLVGQIIDPLQFFTGGPAFKITFDTQLLIDLELPRNSNQRACLVRAKAENLNPHVESTNLDGEAILELVGADIRKGIREAQMNFAGPLPQAVTALNRGLASAIFDKAVYHVDYLADGFVLMDFTFSPWRQFTLAIDRIRENFVTPPFHGSVMTWALVGFERPSVQHGGRPDPPQDVFAGDAPAVKFYAFGLRRVIIHVTITRAVTPQSIKGHLRRLNDGSYEVRWEDGTIDYLPSDFDITTLPPSARSGDDLVKLAWPPVRGGIARSFDLHVDYATGEVSCTIESQRFTGTAGQSMLIPGDTSKPEIWPDVWLTVTTDGTRTPKV